MKSSFKRNLGILLLIFTTTPFLPGRCETASVTQHFTGPKEATVTTNRVVQFQKKQTFRFENTGVFVSNEFEGAHLNNIVQTGPNTYSISIQPENTPINGSPWYAFKLWSTSNQTVQLTLNYASGSHRYAPKTSADGVHWTKLDVSKTHSSGANAMTQIEIGPAPLYFSGQELFTSQDFVQWLNKLCARPFIHTAIIGKSVQGRPIRKFEITEAAKDSECVLVLSRQHPPEVTGTFALLSFVETISADTPLAKDFRKKFRVVVVPLANPDGVVAGNWRHNANGVDLNRDWGQFNQQETRVIRDEFLRQQRQSRGKVRFALDFHSTQHDVFYTVAPESGDLARVASLQTVAVHEKAPAHDLTGRWLQELQERVPDYHVNIEPSKNHSDRATFTSISWLAKTMNAPAVTYEVGDDTDRKLIDKVASNGATILMELLLER